MSFGNCTVGIPMFLLLTACAGGATDAEEPAKEPDDTADSGLPDDSGGADDADGDGYVASARGGDDCDDTTAWVHPGAFEYCDTIDQDCDGAPIAAGACATVVEPLAAATWVVEGPGGAGFGMVGDLTGDGLADFRWGDHSIDAYTVSPGGTLPASGPLQLPAEAHLRVDGSYTLGRALDVGDVDGDGVRDFGAMATVGFLLHFGPFSAGELRGLEDDADAVWPAYPQEYENWAVSLVTGADFDGDGRDDAVVDNRAPPSDDPGYDIDVYFGGDWDERCWMGNHGGGRVERLGDLDGDGAPELHVYASGPFLLSGLDLRTACGATLEDVAIAEMDEAASPVNGEWRDVGDWTGDGVDDFVAGSRSSSSVGDRHGEVFVFSGATVRGAFVSDDAVGSWVGAGDRAGLGSGIHALDFDGDGVKDVAATSSGDADAAYAIFRGGRVPSLHEELPASRLLLGYGMPATSIAAGDYDADGFDDLFLLQERDGDTTRIGVVRGFAVPWDDAGYW